MKATLEIPGKWSVLFESCSEIEESVETETVLCHFIPEGGIRSIPQMQILGESIRQGSFRLYSRNIDSKALKNLVEWKRSVGDRKANERDSFRYEANLNIEVEPPSKLELSWSLSGAWISGLSWTHSSATQKPMLCAEISYDSVQFSDKPVSLKIGTNSFSKKTLPDSVLLNKETLKLSKVDYPYLVIRPNYLTQEPSVSVELSGSKLDNASKNYATDATNRQFKSFSRREMNAIMNPDRKVTERSTTDFPNRQAIYELSFQIFPEAPGDSAFLANKSTISLGWRSLCSVLMKFAPVGELGAVKSSEILKQMDDFLNFTINGNTNDNMKIQTQLNIPKTLLWSFMKYNPFSDNGLDRLESQPLLLYSLPDDNHIHPFLVGIDLSRAGSTEKKKANPDFLGYIRSVSISEAFTDTNAPNSDHLTIKMSLYSNKAILDLRFLDQRGSEFLRESRPIE